MVRSLTVGCAPKRTGCSFELTGKNKKLDHLGFIKFNLLGRTSSRSKYSLTSSTNCSDRSAPCGKAASGGSVWGSVNREMDDAARESRRPISFRNGVNQRKTAVSRQGLLPSIASWARVDPEANLFDLTEAIDLSRRPAREPNRIDIFLRLAGVRGHRDIVAYCPFSGCGTAVCQVHDRRTGEREAADRTERVSSSERNAVLLPSLTTVR
jgi:hypothetical protein